MTREEILAAVRQAAEEYRQEAGEETLDLSLALAFAELDDDQ